MAFAVGAGVGGLCTRLIHQRAAWIAAAALVIAGVVIVIETRRLDRREHDPAQTPGLQSLNSRLPAIGGDIPGQGSHRPFSRPEARPISRHVPGSSPAASSALTASPGRNGVTPAETPAPTLMPVSIQSQAVPIT